MFVFLLHMVPNAGCVQPPDDLASEAWSVAASPRCQRGHGDEPSLRARWMTLASAAEPFEVFECGSYTGLRRSHPGASTATDQAHLFHSSTARWAASLQYSDGHAHCPYGLIGAGDLDALGACAPVDVRRGHDAPVAGLSYDAPQVGARLVDLDGLVSVSGPPALPYTLASADWQLSRDCQAQARIRAGEIVLPPSQERTADACAELSRFTVINRPPDLLDVHSVGVVVARCAEGHIALIHRGFSVSMYDPGTGAFLAGLRFLGDADPMFEAMGDLSALDGCTVACWATDFGDDVPCLPDPAPFDAVPPWRVFLGRSRTTEESGSPPRRPRTAPARPASSRSSVTRPAPPSPRSDAWN